MHLKMEGTPVLMVVENPHVMQMALSIPASIIVIVNRDSDTQNRCQSVHADGEPDFSATWLSHSIMMAPHDLTAMTGPYPQMAAFWSSKLPATSRSECVGVHNSIPPRHYPFPHDLPTSPLMWWFPSEG